MNYSPYNSGSRRCVVCGRPLKTGRKYCYLHRSLGKERREHSRGDGGELLIILFAIIMTIAITGFLMYYTVRFISSHWIWFLILSILVLAFEIYRIKSIGIKGINKFEIWIIAVFGAIIIIMIMWGLSSYGENKTREKNPLTLKYNCTELVKQRGLSFTSVNYFENNLSVFEWYGNYTPKGGQSDFISKCRISNAQFPATIFGRDVWYKSVLVCDRNNQLVKCPDAESVDEKI